MINSDNSLLLIIDIQEKLVKMLGETDLPNNIYTLLKASEILNIPSVITEQYPRGLGETVEIVKEGNKNSKFLEKTSFSAFEQIKDLINDNKQIILCGIEAHICVLQTAYDLINNGCKVYIPADCCASRRKIDYDISLEFFKQNNIQVVSKEIVIFSWLKSSRHPYFKEIQKLIK